MRGESSARGGGKTTRMIAVMRQREDAVMVVRSHRERQRIIGMHPDLQGRIFTFDDFEKRPRGVVRPDTPVCVDDADDFLRRMFGNVTVFSYTSDDDTEGA